MKYFAYYKIETETSLMEVMALNEGLMNILIKYLKFLCLIIPSWKLEISSESFFIL